MRCSVPSTTSSGPEPAARAVDPRVGEEAAQFAALLLREVVKPVGEELGPLVGGIAIDAFAGALARSGGAGLTAMLTREAERANGS